MAVLKITFKQTWLSIAIFLVATLLSHSSTQGDFSFNTFQLGYPFEFFLKGWECGADSPTIIWTLKNLFYDYIFCFLITVNYNFPFGWKLQKSELFKFLKMPNWVFFIIWLALSFIVGLLLINNFQNTNGKEFSRMWLLNYGFLSFWIIGILKALRIIVIQFMTSNKKYSS